MEQADYRGLCIEIFGTDDEMKIRKAVKSFKEKNGRNAGRKKIFSEDVLARAQLMLANGTSIQDIAANFGVSRKCISQYLNERPGENFTMRIEFRKGTRICTVIYVDFLDEKIVVQNRTSDIFDRAFGVVENPTWEDFQEFLASRCFPRTRSHVKDILRGIGVDSYDPLAIAEATGGRTAEDDMYMTFKTYPKGGAVCKKLN